MTENRKQQACFAVEIRKSVGYIKPMDFLFYGWGYQAVSCQPLAISSQQLATSSQKLEARRQEIEASHQLLAARRHQSNRFFTLCHCSTSLPFLYGILVPVQNDRGRQGVIMRKASVVILNEREGSITVVRKTVRCHPSNRFFTLCHYSVSRLSQTAFLPPFRMIGDGKGS